MSVRIIGPVLMFIIVTGSGLCLTGCRDNSSDTEPRVIHPPLTGRKILMVIAPDKFRDEELFTPREHFMARGAEVTVASSSSGQVSGMLGRTFSPEAKLADVRAGDYDAVVFVGGSGAKTYFDDAVAHKLARAAAGGGKVLGAICIAPAILAKAGVLKDRSATAFVSVRNILVAGGARVMDNSCVRDGKIITADGPAAAEEFAAAITKALTE